MLVFAETIASRSVRSPSLPSRSYAVDFTVIYEFPASPPGEFARNSAATVASAATLVMISGSRGTDISASIGGILPLSGQRMPEVYFGGATGSTRQSRASLEHLLPEHLGLSAVRPVPRRGAKCVLLSDVTLAS